mmetsp:Transcript_7419/g.21936  ORF Transcript_7419/g.21936 Transcript_7419/m.21936 type:complete len:233 (+) Transcript_7419:1789-2487(+)
MKQSRSGVITSRTSLCLKLSAPMSRRWSARVSPLSRCAAGSVQCRSISRSSSSWLYTVPMSRPRMRSRPSDMGYAIGHSRNVKTFTSGIREAPIRSPCRVHMDCGTISPNKTMSPVEMMRPATPLVTSATMILVAALTMVLPSSSVHSSKLPFSRMGMMSRACSRSSASPPSSRIFRPFISKDNSPSVNPENSAHSGTNTRDTISTDASTPRPPGWSTSHLRPTVSRHALTQ